MWLFSLYLLGGTPSYPEDGTFTFCSQNTSSYPDPYDPIPADGTFTFCSQDTSSYPRP